MAEGVLSPLLNVIIEKLESKFTGEDRLLRGIKKDITRLSDMLKKFQAWTNDAEQREVKEAVVRRWLKELEDAAYDADDITDEFATELVDLKAMEDGISTLENQVCHFSPLGLWLKQVYLRHKIGKGIREIREKINNIMEEGLELELREGVTKERIETGERLTSSLVAESEIYGRNEDKITIVGMLLDNLELEDLSVISIVGMGGIGKTVLAQLVYNDEKVAMHFEIKIWIRVSDEFDIKRLISGIIERITGENAPVLGMDRLQSRLRKVLNQRRYLLVLDDVWNEDVEKWNRMKTLLRSCGGQGSKILVTTRSQKVARIMGTSNPLLLRGLSDDECWSLFKERAFGGEIKNADPNLVQIGKEIVRKCKGVPLAVKALGGMLYFRREEAEWLFIRDNDVWNLLEDESNNILPALKLSYNNLPAHLKQCFAYCSIFPKDHEIEKETLIQQWISEGFIQSSDGCRLAEDVGNDYFDDLLWRSFFRDIGTDGWGNIKKCKLHDLIHDLAQSVTRDSCLILDLNNDQEIIPKKIRRLSLVGDGNAIMPMSLYEAKSLRTFIISRECTGLELPRETIDEMFLSFRFLRVLTITNYNERELPTSLGNLIHLKYFDISCTWIVKLPGSINKLKNLQTLILGCGFEELPQDLSGFKNLQHLDISKCYLLTSTPSKIGELSFLQTLPIFIVSRDSRCGIGELQSLNCLRGSIKIENLENVENGADARQANLKDKRNLQKLGLFWSNNTPTRNIEEVLEGLQPPQNLKTLFMENYRGVYFSRWLMDLMLPNLVHISLHNCQNCDLLPAFGSLPSLEILNLKKMHGVKHLSVEFNKSYRVEGFPLLKKLYLHDMPNLEELLHTHGNDLFPRLEELIISCCPKLTSLPTLSSLKKLYLHKSNSMILNSIASLTSLSLLGIYVFEELKFLPEAMLQPLNLLQSLQIWNCHELRSLPRELEKLTSLEELAIIDCSELECLPELHYLTSLKLLDVCGCDNLTSFPDKAMQGLTALKRLSIQKCCKLTCLPSGFRHITLLEDLTICDVVPALSALPEDLQHLTNLKMFVLGGFDMFTSLPEWLGNLTSLQSLKISDLKNVTSLPTGMQHLSSLRDLSIYSCPHLEKRCRRATGEDWHKIQHIRGVHIHSAQPLQYSWLMNERLVSNYMKTYEIAFDCFP